MEITEILEKATEREGISGELAGMMLSTPFPLEPCKKDGIPGVRLESPSGTLSFFPGEIPALTAETDTSAFACYLGDKSDLCLDLKTGRDSAPSAVRSAAMRVLVGYREESPGPKVVFVINGRGGAGKDTLISGASRIFAVENISSIDPVRRAAALIGWNGKKDRKGRKLLSDLKAALTAYDNSPENSVLRRLRAFLSSGKKALFVHIREPEAIESFKEKAGVPVRTVLVRTHPKELGNASDDRAEEYGYDIIIDNSGPLWQAQRDFNRMLAAELRAAGAKEGGEFEPVSHT